MNARDLVRRAIGEKAVLDEAKLLHDQTRAALLKGMEPGDRIKVKDGDTLWTISKKFKVSSVLIKEWNNLKTDVIHPGSQLKVKKV